MTHLSRRSLLRGAVAGAAGLTVASALPRSAWGATNPGVPLPTATGTPIGPRPYPNLPAGTANTELPFEHVVVIMQENHSFDNYFGMLSKRGNERVDGFTFAPGTMNPVNENPHASGQWQRVFHMEGTCQPGDCSQGWDSSHTQVNGGRMDGFSGNWPAAMGYFDESDLPYYYSLGQTFCVGNRSFCSVLGQTYPNRRFLYAGTASGMTSTTTDTFTTVPYPSGGTLWDVLSANNVSWKSYFTDLPVVGIIPQTVEKYPTNFTTVAEFFADVAAGTLPSVSFIDTEAGGADEVGGELSNFYGPLAATGALPAGFSSDGSSAIQTVRSQNGDEEGPADVALGEQSVASFINAIMANKALWQKTLIIWTYDEHGGYYDHVAPPPAVNPDNVPVNPSYNQYNQYQTMGIRIPTVVISPWSKANNVSNVAHDHTAVIKTIATKWNLPALTQRDLAAPTLFDYVDFNNPQYMTPPTLATPAQLATVQGDCATTPPAYAYDSAPYTAPPVAALPDAAAPVLLPLAGLTGAALLAVKRWNARQSHNAGVALAEREGVKPPHEPAILSATPADHRPGKASQ